MNTKAQVETAQIEEIDFNPDIMKRLPRGTFLATPGETSDPRKTKVRVTLYLDSDILTYFKERAAQPNAAPYQTQINNELRSLMERDAPVAFDYTSLLENRPFIAALAEKVQQYQTEEK